MELAAANVHRSLGYLVALDTQGYRPTAAELEAYAEQPDRRTPRFENSITRVWMSTFRNLAFALEEVEPGEDMASHFLRLRWAQDIDGRLHVTPLGRAVYRALQQQALEPEAVLDVVIEATDSTAFARDVGRMAEAGSALLVEPYFRLDVLMPIIEFTEITRVLTTERTSKSDRNTPKLAVEKLTVDRPFEVRVASKDVHDRYLVPDSGPVQFVGASLNGLGQVATAMGTLHDGSDEIRNLYESIWTSSPTHAVARKPSSDARSSAKATKAPAKAAKSRKAT